MSHYRGVTDANINLSDCSTQREESPLSKRPRKQQQPKKIVPTTEIQVVRRSPKRRRKNQPIDYVSQLRDKHISRLIMRKGLRCFWCRSWSEVFPYHTFSSLVLHKMWHHRRDKFGCEHCSVRYRHRYQVVLHSSRAHLPRLSREQIPNQPHKPSHCQISLAINNHDNSLHDSVPALMPRNSEVLPAETTLSDALSNDKIVPSVTPSVEVSTLPSDVEDINMKIPNFLSSLQDLQSNQFVFRPSDIFGNSKSLQQSDSENSKTSSQDIKTYSLFNKIESDKPETDITIQGLQNLGKTVSDDIMRNVDAMPSVTSNNNLISQIEVNEKVNQNLENSQIQDLIETSGLTGSNGPMPLVIPSYPPSG